MRTDNAPTISRRDYQPYPYRLPNVELTLDLDAEQTRVHTRMEFERTDAQAQPLVLNGQDLQLEATALNGQIGRESCRERVCQYVEIWVVAGSVKKKKSMTTSITRH